MVRLIRGLRSLQAYGSSRCLQDSLGGGFRVLPGAQGAPRWILGGPPEGRGCSKIVLAFGVSLGAAAVCSPLVAIALIAVIVVTASIIVIGIIVVGAIFVIVVVVCRRRRPQRLQFSVSA